MRHPIRLFSIALFGLCLVVAPAVGGAGRVPAPRGAADARARLLACDSAVVMLEVLASSDSHTMSDGTVRSSSSSEVLAIGYDGAAWVRRFADALLPAGREWRSRMAPAVELDRADGRDPWTVRVQAYANGKLQSSWVVNLLDGWAGEGLGPPTVFDLLGSPDSLRAVLASGMRAYPDGASRLRKLHEPDATILPLPERMRR